MFPTKTPYPIKSIFRHYTWDLYDTTESKKLYLTFDDGPIPEVTEFVLAQLALYDAKATFFCIGNNIEKHPEIFQKIIAHGHAIGNHTMQHLSAWKSSKTAYIADVLACEKSIAHHIQSKKKLFRPPYGHVSQSKLKRLQHMGYEIIMWDVLAKDWLQTLDVNHQLQLIQSKSRPGSILVFHDSIKASKNIYELLPKTLAYFSSTGYTFDTIR